MWIWSMYSRFCHSHPYIHVFSWNLNVCWISLSLWAQLKESVCLKFPYDVAPWPQTASWIRSKPRRCGSLLPTSVNFVDCLATFVERDLCHMICLIKKRGLSLENASFVYDLCNPCLPARSFHLFFLSCSLPSSTSSSLFSPQLPPNPTTTTTTTTLLLNAP